MFVQTFKLRIISFITLLLIPKLTTSNLLNANLLCLTFVRQRKHRRMLRPLKTTSVFAHIISTLFIWFIGTLIHPYS